MANNKQFVVIGLGSFGMALARRLARNGCRVTGLDRSPERVDLLKQELYEAVIGDATEPDALQHLPVKDAAAVFIATGEEITHSLLAALHVKELGARRIIVKGVSGEHGKLLKCLGVERVIFPEIEIAESLGDRMTWPNVIDFLPIDPEYSIVEIAVPASLAGKTLQQADVRRKCGVYILGIKDVMTDSLKLFPDGDFTLNDEQILVAIGRQQQLNQLRDLK